MTSSAWGLVNETGAWQTVGADDARHVRLAVTVPLRLAADGNRNGITPTVAATIRQGLLATANGALDAKFVTCANHLKAGGHGDAILRIGHEPEIAWYPWSLLGGNADVYCWRSPAAGPCSARCRPNFQVDYNTNCDALLSYPGFANRLSAGYPGDEHVDIVGIDIYNRAPWATNLNKLNAVATFAAAHGKLLSVPEWGLWKNETGDDADLHPEHARLVRASDQRPGACCTRATSGTGRRATSTRRPSTVSATRRPTPRPATGRCSACDSAHPHWFSRRRRAASRWRDQRDATVLDSPQWTPLRASTLGIVLRRIARSCRSW